MKGEEKSTTGRFPGNSVNIEGMGKGKRHLEGRAREVRRKTRNMTVKRKSVANSINLSKRLRKTRAEKTPLA